MKWFEQHTNEHESITGRQILKEWGAEGYGAYIILKQIIGQNMGDDAAEWGFVSPTETIKTLADKCHMDLAQFRKFLTFCDDRFILEKRDGRLFMPSILEQKNEYFKKLQRKNEKVKKPEYPDIPEYPDKTEKMESPDRMPHNHNHNHNHNTKELLPKGNKVLAAPETAQHSSSEEKKPSPLIEHTLAEFKRVYGFKPTDKKPRFVAQNLIQRMKSITRERIGGDITDDRLKRGISRFFDWLGGQESLEHIQKLETAKLKLNIFMETIPRKEQDAKPN